MASPKRIFIVEDQGIVAADLASRLEQMGYQVAGSATSGQESVEKVGFTQPDLVLMDIVLAGPMDGIQAAELIAQRHEIPIVFLTAHADQATAQRAQIIGPFGYVLKPFDQRELHVAIEIALYRGRVEAELRRLNRELREALDQVKTLQGVLPICAWCKKILDDDGNWETVDRYLVSHSEAKLSHSICPECEATYRRALDAAARETGQNPQSSSSV